MEIKHLRQYQRILQFLLIFYCYRLVQFGAVSIEAMCRNIWAKFLYQERLNALCPICERHELFQPTNAEMVSNAVMSNNHHRILSVLCLPTSFVM